MVNAHYFDSDVYGGWDCVRYQNEVTYCDKEKFLCLAHEVITFLILIIGVLVLVVVSENNRAYRKKAA